MLKITSMILVALMSLGLSTYSFAEGHDSGSEESGSDQPIHWETDAEYAAKVKVWKDFLASVKKTAKAAGETAKSLLDKSRDYCAKVDCDAPKNPEEGSSE